MKRYLLNILAFSAFTCCAQFVNAQTDTVPTQIEEEEAGFILVEKMPEFPGGQSALFKFLSENVKYPKEAVKKGIQGRVICQFVVEKDGSISNVEVVRSGGHHLLDQEAVRVISIMPKWKPGTQRGKPIRVKYTIPVNFRLPEGSSAKAQNTTYSTSSNSNKSNAAKEEQQTGKNEPQLQRTWNNEIDGDRLFREGKYESAEKAYLNAIKESGATEDLNSKVKLAKQCALLLSQARQAEKEASETNYQKYNEAKRLYWELSIKHGLPIYEEKVNLLKKKADICVALQSKKEGDDLFRNEDYNSAAKKYIKAAENAGDSLFAQYELQNTLACAKLLDLALQNKREAELNNDAVNYLAAYKFYYALYQYNPLPKYISEIERLRKYIDMPRKEHETPSFPGGEKALFNYLEEKLDLTIPTGYYKEDVYVTCRFVVSANGDITQAEVVEPCQYDSLNVLALSMVEQMPRWTPGRRNGNLVSFTYLVPIGFRLLREDCVDLGLPSGLKWAAMNIGARSPFEVGNHYQWGCTSPREISSWSGYCYGARDALNRYCTVEKSGKLDYLSELQKSDDIATLLLGDNWKTPTREDFRELWKYCKRTWETHGDVCGYRFVGTNGKSIFLPANGWFDKDGQLHQINIEGEYWTSSLNTKECNGAAYLIIGKGVKSEGVLWGHSNRHWCLGIRPVCK